MSDATIRHGRSMRDIRRTQAEDRNLRLQAAARAFYAKAKLLHAAGAAFSLVLALLAPILLFLAPNAGALLGALAGIWLFVTRLVVQPICDQRQLDAAATQEAFDCDVLGLNWNASLARRVADEDIRSATRKVDLKRVANWYPADNDMDWPTSVLTCQRSNVVWARRQHRAYGQTLSSVVVVWAAIGIVVALVHGATLATYLVAIALPSLPALLDASELARSHFSAGGDRMQLEEVIDAQLADPAEVDQGQLRENQDRLFVQRRDAPQVPDWFYKLVASRFEEDMKYAAAQRAMSRDSGSDGKSDGAT